MKTKTLIIVGITLMILSIDGFWFVSSEIHDHCIFNMEIGHNVYADSYKPCDIATYAITTSGIFLVAGIGILIFVISYNVKHASILSNKIEG